MDNYIDVERSIIKRFRKEIWRKFISAVNEYQLIKEGDKIAVCISGGKDSMLLAKCMQELQRHGKVKFETVFLVMNPGYNEYNKQVILNNAEYLNIPIHMFETDIFDIVATVEESPCYLCARMRRGYLYKHAKELGCNKIALGHHFDDVIETVLMSMLYSGQMKGMMPKLHSTNYEGMELIRPLYMVKEADIIAWRKYNNLQFIQCACRFTENCMLGDNGGGSKRQEMKELIKKFRQTSSIIDMNIFRSVHNVNLDTMIGYQKKQVFHSFLDDYDTDISSVNSENE
ncbi:tRNA 2-thiocytidine biosynthesis protein TtcA [Anaerocolumna sedimenticola]|uniref:tRNA 2-thiocytidine biosynthesis protein TtcA n=1 Tax=Anaerocolumna sedimenticola TaxID=2696063 RepID=A0A6P1TPJ6_9FIRM|nr:ATP-binding protein [Anaerocolumna sedimenticola]QHQ61811.1 tRNA 2-thiocytidine biosynthesis protein TtcA [Anaerocolumna sedimenticola]